MSRVELEEWADNLPVNYLLCRSKKHNLIEKDTWPVGRNGAGTLWRCTSCRLEITEIIDGRGFVVDQKPTYPPGYLAPKGAGRATKERNGMLRIRRARRALERKASKG